MEQVTAATNAIAERIVTVTGGYARQKVNTFKQQIASDQQQLDAIDQQSNQIQSTAEQARPQQSA